MRSGLYLTVFAGVLCAPFAASSGEPPPRFSAVGQNILIPCALVRKHAAPEFIAQAEREADLGGRPALETILQHFARLSRACAMPRQNGEKRND